ncbi:MAG: alpha/beta hydrolase, partial [Woeseiaceae bacterium]
SWLPYFEKFAWMSILPEIDPFKFTSFPKRAGWEIHRVTRRVHRMLGEAARREALPPVLTFQSVIDNTVSSGAVAAVLYERLPANGSHLVVYDVNRNSTIVELMLDEPPDPLDFFRSGAPRDYHVTVIGNASRSTLAVRATTVAAGDAPASAVETGLMWPPEVYSLSHVALPFRSDDPVYGNGADRSRPVGRIVIGALSPRGEPGLLRLPAEFFQRTRYNVFYPLQDRMIVQWLAGG